VLESEICNSASADYGCHSRMWWQDAYVREYIPSITLLTVDDYEAAQNDFFESFRNFDEAGSLQRIQVLKYFVLANMLMESEIDPFSSQETKPYTPISIVINHKIQE